ncbi:MAG: hypothetical protein AMXMBFR44_5400 [Candidatus Campbellbacteria bacterium]
MQRQRITKSKLPDAPGVYFFKKGRRILYIGKATSLRERVRSYFSSDLGEARGARIVKMVDEATSVVVEQTDSVLEALILEAALIKKHQPHYNVEEKDDKSFNYVVVTDEAYPRVFTVRQRELLVGGHDAYKKMFGPFTQGGQLKEALKLIRKIFPFRGKNDAPLSNEKRKSRLYQELGLAPDVSRLGAKEYARTIRHVVLFFEGKKKELVRTITREMKAAAKAREFERAAELRRRLFALQHINDVALLKSDIRHPKSEQRIEAYDVAHTGETNRIGVMTVVEDGEANRREYRTFTIKTAGAGDTAALREILERRLHHSEWALPKLVVVDGGAAQKNAAERTLKEFGYRIPVVAVTKNERHQPERIVGDREHISGHERAILLANAEAHRFSLSKHRKKRSSFRA